MFMQVNNFVVFEGFFKNRSDFSRISSQGRSLTYSRSYRPLSRAVSDDVIKRSRCVFSSFASLEDSYNEVALLPFT